MQPSHHLIVKADCLNHLAAHLPSLSYSKAILLSHPSLIQLYGIRIKKQLQELKLPVIEILILEGEKNKTLKQAMQCWKQMINHQIDRHSVVIALGGGVICDMAGFLASCYMRGIDTICLPTTLLAMVDAALGGKTGVNLNSCKNAIGSFHHPQSILIDPTCLQTLSQREFISGLAEVIKYGMIEDSCLFEQLERNMTKLLDRDEALLELIIKQACSIKNKIVGRDYHDQNERILLNYGHTFGHALEALTHYRRYLHGEAVSIGMSCAAHLSCKMGLTDSDTVKKQDNLCLQAHLPISLPAPLNLEKWIELMKGDKKAKFGKINLILPEKIGKVVNICDVDPVFIKQALLTKK